MVMFFLLKVNLQSKLQLLPVLLQAHDLPPHPTFGIDDTSMIFYGSSIHRKQRLHIFYTGQTRTHTYIHT